MSHLVRASAALGALALAVAVPGGAPPRRTKPKHTTTVRTVTRCRRRRPRTSAASAARAGRRRRSASAARAGRPRSGPDRDDVCSGGTRTVFTSGGTVTKTSRSRAHGPRLPAARAAAAAEAVPAHAAAQQRRRVQVRRRRLDRQLRRRHALQDRARPPARRGRRLPTPTRAGKDKGTVVVTSGDNFLAGLNLRASFQRKDAGPGSFYDAIALGRIGYDAITIGNHEYDFGPARLAQLIPPSARRAVPDGQHGLQRRARAAGAARPRAASPTRRSSPRAARRSASSASPRPRVPNISSPGPNVKFLPTSQGSSTRRPRG